MDDARLTCATVVTGEAVQPETVELGDDSVALRWRHDLRQPLAVMRFLVDAIASNDELPADALAALRQIEQQAEWMSRLLSSMPEDCEDVAVVDLAETVARSCSIAVPDADYRVRFEKFDDARVLVDPVGLERAARNLVDNALRAVAGGGTVDVRVWAEDRDGVLEVADSGPGFGHLQPRHGHGLVGARAFARRFGGDLTCGTSSLGGALVTLRLPLATGW